MPQLNAEQIAQRAFELSLLDERQLNEVWGQFGRRNVPGEDFVQMLLRRELMTNYQIERLIKGERGGFFYGDYKVLYLVATGSFARVYRAMQKETGNTVALKVLRHRYSDDKTQTDQFHREGLVGCRLRHANIVPIYEVFSQGFTHFLVMEFIEGRNLRDFLKVRKKLEPAEAIRLLTDMTNGLHYAQQHGVSHRDIKMTNVLISSRGQAKLVDFGLAAADENINDEAISNHPNPRTIDYAGLERASGVRKDDVRSDIYFIGCMFYHMLVGRAPLSETRDRIKRLSKARFMEVVPVHKADPSIPRVVAAVVNKAMMFDPSRRYQSPGEMLVDLRAAAQKLAEGKDIDLNDDGEARSGVASAKQRERWAAMLLPESERPVLMFVERNADLQNIFRSGMKKIGYRVLLTSDPLRPGVRFSEDDAAAHCVVFSTSDLGRPALDAFNAFAEGAATKNVPAILLLAESHLKWRSEANLAPHRRVLTMPLKLKDFRAALAELAPVVVRQV